MTRVLLLATTTGYQIRSFGEAARALGATLILASDRCDQLDDPWWDRAIPVRFHDEAGSVDRVVAAFVAPPDGIITVGDRPTILAARLAERFGLDGNTPAAAATSRNKLATREALERRGLPTPWFVPISLDGEVSSLADSLCYPAVLKPLALSGSRGVIRVDDPRGFVEAADRLRRILSARDVLADRDRDHAGALVEEFIPGREFALEGLLTRGVFTTLAIFDKPDPLDGPFFEETIYVTPSRRREGGEGIATAVARAAEAIGLHHGPVHAECRVNDRGIYVLEVAARPIGGLCARALRFQSPRGRVCSLEELLLRHGLREDLRGYAREDRASGVMMIPIPARGVLKGIDGEDRARAVPCVTDVRITAKRDSLLEPLPEGRSYLGFIFAEAETPALVEDALRKAHAALRFVVEREIRVG